MAYPTNPIYKLVKNPITSQVTSVLTQTGNSEPYIVKSIPFDEANTDYQEYLAWKAEGNEPEAAD
tara:strand:+ start:463 stop:657 length:195 start_codon:yes stop_codon:yes gene_type:complete